MFAKWLPRIADFVIHSVLAVPVAMLLGFIPEAFAGSIYHNTFLEPFVPMITLTAVILAMLSSKWIRSSVAKWVWILPLLWFVWGMLELAHYWSPAWDTSGNRRSYALKEHFTPQCGSTECVYEALDTTPLISAVAYSITYIILLKRPGTRRFKWSHLSKPSVVA